MYEYIFLFVLALAWMIFAVVQDLRMKEIANWLNFSLIAFVLAYRGFYAIWSNNFEFFIYGVIGVLFFVGLGFAFYYGKVFAGGDAKLLMGLGGIFPYQSYFDFITLGLGFVFLIFLSGVLWTLVYSIHLIARNNKVFKSNFKKEIIKDKWLILSSVVLFLVIEIYSFKFDKLYIGIFGIFMLILPFLYSYAKALENLMFVMKNPGDLMEGDWLAKNVKLGKKIIKKNVHGLSKDDIRLLKRANKKVMIKEGVPFGPAFLIGFVLFLVVYYKFGF